MSVLGVVVRVSPVHRETVLQRLARTPGVDLGPDPQDGRLIAVIESTADDPAAATMAAIAGWPEVHNLSLVYEHSDAEPGDAPAEAEFDFRAWRQSVGDFARGQTSRDARPSDLPASTSQRVQALRRSEVEQGRLQAHAPTLSPDGDGALDPGRFFDAGQAITAPAADTNAAARQRRR